ncbi:hypothetical protein BVI2075_140004 [Burkholderia vietnamiensis]|nr:hypothetical protein BVI2075_140004 [Burkholderia vietnamiensis]
MKRYLGRCSGGLLPNGWGIGPGKSMARHW